MNVTPYEIPLSPESQRFDITLLGTDYIMFVVWNPIALYWVLDISDANGVPLICGIPLITGCDLLDQYESVGLGGGLVVTTDNGIGVPTFAGLGVTGHLYFVVPA